jgi:hypothetical protein
VARLVFDEQIANPKLISAIQERGIDAAQVGDFGAQGTADPEVVRRVAEALGSAWVLVTMDGTIMEDSRGFEWERYAIAWVQVRDGLLGARVEQAKTEIVQRHAHAMRTQRPGDHHTYTVDKHFKYPPSLATRLRPK